MKFTARVISGAGRGKTLGVPTVNMQLEDVPYDLKEGVHACRVRADDDRTWHLGALYFGPRPTFNDSKSCEVHLIDEVLSVTPKTVEIDVVKFLRKVETFPSGDALGKQMQEDIRRSKAILQA